MKIVPRIVVLVVVLAMSVMVVAVPVSAAPNAQFPNPLGTHTVQQGEWIYCIARAYKVTPWSIASANAIPWPYWVFPGQVLQIPADTPTPGPYPTPAPYPTPVPGTCRYYHYVLWGQTLSGIAWYYGTTVQAIMTANPSITNPNLIYAGSTLCIP